MINTALSGVGTTSAFHNRPAQQSVNNAPRNQDFIENDAQSGPETSIANLVRLNISFETAIEQARQISAQLLQQPFSIANDEPQFVTALVS